MQELRLDFQRLTVNSSTFRVDIAGLTECLTLHAFSALRVKRVFRLDALCRGGKCEAADGKIFASFFHL